MLPMLAAILPETILALGSLILVILSLTWFGKSHTRIHALCQLLLMAAIAASLTAAATYSKTPLYHGMILWDHFAAVLKPALLLSTIFVCYYSRQNMTEKVVPLGEYYCLILLSVSGMCLLVQANHLLMMYLGLELMSLPIYALVAMRRDGKTNYEAALKYFVLGAVASGFILYAFSLLYGLTGSLQADVIIKQIATLLTQKQHLLSAKLSLTLACGFIIIGMALKFGLVPCHTWVPDIYEGAPTEVTLFIATVPKLATFGFLYRICAKTLLFAGKFWLPLWMIIGIASIILGNLVAITQTNFKRMLAYSSIAHMGYMIIAIVAFTKTGFTAALFYLFVYVLTTILVFGVILLIENNTQITLIEDLSGLNQASPKLAFLLLLCLFSFAGIPPIIGFMGKLGMLHALIQSRHLVLATVAIVASVIGCFYYLRVIKTVYFNPLKPESSLSKLTKPRKDQEGWHGALLGQSLLVIVFGLIPSALIVASQIAIVGKATL
jgi:NADH-quinone oxidoreductase subunit N